MCWLSRVYVSLADRLCIPEPEGGAGPFVDAFLDRWLHEPWPAPHPATKEEPWTSG